MVVFYLEFLFLLLFGKNQGALAGFCEKRRDIRVWGEGFSRK